MAPASSLRKETRRQGHGVERPRPPAARRGDQEKSGGEDRSVMTAMTEGRNNVKWRLAVNFGWRTYVCMFVWSQKLIGINESWRYLVT